MRKLILGYDKNPSISHQYNAGVISDCVKLDEKILDVGCWSGQLCAALPKNSYNFTGIDVSSEAILFAKKTYPRYVWKVAGASKLPFANNLFDCVVIFEVFEHVDDEIKCLEEISRVLKKGGILILSTPAYNFLSIMSDPAYFLLKHRHYKRSDLIKFIKPNFHVKKIWMKGGFIYVSLYLSQMFFKHIIKYNIPMFIQNYWAKLAKIEFFQNEGFLGYYLIATKK